MAPLATEIVVDVPLADLEVDPYPLYGWMRKEQPIAYVPETGRVWVTTWDLCAQAGGNDDIFGPTQDAHHKVYGRPNVMALTGEAHLEARAPLDSRFRPRAVKEYVDSNLRATAIRYIDAVRDRGCADLSVDVFEPISVRSIGDVLGFSDVDVETLRAWFYGLAAYLTDYGRDPRTAERSAAVKREIREYLDTRVEELSASHDGSTLAHMLLDGMPEGTTRDLDEIIPTLCTMIVGGFQEPAHGTSNTVLGLLGRPDQASALVGDPRGNSARAVQEGLRWIAPFTMTEKLTTADVDLGGTSIPAGTEIALVMGSANRDETRFEHPDIYDLARSRPGNQSFGYGIHLCVGHFVARQLAKVCIEELFQRLPGLRLDPDREPFVHGWFVRAAKNLPVVWDA
jgi:aromatic O-demethylase, cytochrome P450 subunit